LPWFMGDLVGTGCDAGWSSFVAIVQDLVRHWTNMSVFLVAGLIWLLRRRRRIVGWPTSGRFPLLLAPPVLACLWIGTYSLGSLALVVWPFTARRGCALREFITLPEAALPAAVVALALLHFILWRWERLFPSSYEP
jgi:hypothetical protein